MKEENLIKTNPLYYHSYKFFHLLNYAKTNQGMLICIGLEVKDHQLQKKENKEI